jgi:PPOX class probable F420-dependent enzyme
MKEITEPVAKLLEDKNFAFIATLMPDGSPQITPVWIDLDKNTNTILINTASGRKKMDNVSRDPRVAISVANQKNPYEMVSIRGEVVEKNTDNADDHIDKLAKKYLDVDKYPFRSPNEKRVLLKIKPDKIHYQQPQ